MIDKTKKTRFPLTLPIPTKEKLEKLSNSQGIAINALIMLAINDYLKKLENS